MKSLLLTFLLLCGTIFFSYSQCTPMWPDTSHGIMPDTTTNLPPANAGSPYETVVQFRVPTSGPSPFGGTFPIDHIVLTSVDGLATIPSYVTFTFQCNPSDCAFAADSLGCVRLSGTPTTPGTYNLTINTNVYTSSVAYFPYQTPGYRIVVHNPIGVETLSDKSFDVSQNLPNPVNTKTNIYLNLEHAGNFSVKISNLVGNEMLKQNITGKKGFNTVSIDASHFAPGIYFYIVSDGEHSVTKRMVVDKK